MRRTLEDIYGKEKTSPTDGKHEQIAVGYHKCASGYPGGEKMLGLGLAKVSSLPNVCNGVRLEELRQRLREELTDMQGVKGRLQKDPPRITLTK